MSLVYDYDNINSPLGSMLNTNMNNASSLAFGCSTEFHGIVQTERLERTLMIKFLINHVNKMILSTFNIHFEISKLDEFVSSLFKRLNLTLRSYQKLIILLIRYLNNELEYEHATNETNDPYDNHDFFHNYESCLKHVIIGLLMTMLQNDEIQWSKITGLSDYVLDQVEHNFQFKENTLFVNENEIDQINLQMKSIIYRFFSVV